MVLNYYRLFLSNNASSPSSLQSSSATELLSLPSLYLWYRKGTNLWKSNRKDEVFDVYLDCCQDSFSKVLSSELRNIFSDGLNNGRSLGIQNKQRGAVVLRKTMDKVLSELDKVRLWCDHVYVWCSLDASLLLMLTLLLYVLISLISEPRKRMKWPNWRRMRLQLLKRRYVSLMMMIMLLLFRVAYIDNNDCVYSIDLSLWFLFDDICDGW